MSVFQRPNSIRELKIEPNISRECFVICFSTSCYVQSMASIFIAGRVMLGAKSWDFCGIVATGFSNSAIMELPVVTTRPCSNTTNIKTGKNSVFRAQKFL